MIRRPRFLLIAICMIVVGWPACPRALTIDSERQFQFAEELFNSKQYRRAAEEYQRFSFFFPEDSRQLRPILCRKLDEISHDPKPESA